MAPLVLALRTDKAFASVKAWIDSKAIGGWAVREVSGDNEHWHWLLETEAFRNVQSFRVLFTRACPELRGNSSYSVSEVKDLEKYERYMAKGETQGVLPEVAWRNSVRYDDEKVEALHEEYWTENAKLKRRKVGTALDSVYDDCKRDSVQWNDREAIAEKYIRELVSRNRPLNLFAARAAVNTIQIKLCPNDDAIRLFKEQV